MHLVTLKEAGLQLGELIKEVAQGEEVVIKRNDGTAFKIVPVSKVVPSAQFGSAKGLVEMSEDFDAPLEDFKRYEQ